MQKIRGILYGESVLDWLVEHGRGLLFSYGDKKAIYDIVVENPTTRGDILTYQLCVKLEKDKVHEFYVDQNGDIIENCDIFTIAKRLCRKPHEIYDMMRLVESMVF